MATNAARNLLILGGVGVLGYWWYTSMKSAQAAGPRGISGGTPTGGTPTLGTGGTPTGGKGAGGTSTGEVSTQTERETPQTERETPQTERETGYVEPSDADYRYGATGGGGEPVFEDTSSYFGPGDEYDYGTRGPSGDEYDYGTRG